MKSFDFNFIQRRDANSDTYSGWVKWMLRNIECFGQFQFVLLFFYCFLKIICCLLLNFAASKHYLDLDLLFHRWISFEIRYPYRSWEMSLIQMLNHSFAQSFLKGIYKQNICNICIRIQSNGGLKLKTKDSISPRAYWLVLSHLISWLNN